MSLYRDKDAAAIEVPGDDSPPLGPECLRPLGQAFIDLAERLGA